MATMMMATMPEHPAPNAYSGDKPRRRHPAAILTSVKQTTKAIPAGPGVGKYHTGEVEERLRSKQSIILMGRPADDSKRKGLASQTPGPASYNTDGAKKKKAPAAHITSRGPDPNAKRESDVTPGPSSYRTETKHAVGAGDGPSYSMVFRGKVTKSRVPLASSATAPGPGEYTPADAYLRANAPSAVLTSRIPSKTESFGPGVAKYSGLDLDAVRRAEGKGRGGALLLGRGRDEGSDVKKQGPGPGKYSGDMRALYGETKGGRMYFREKQKEETLGPGPGKYDGRGYGDTIGEAKGGLMSFRPKEPEAHDPSPAPNQYTTDNGTIGATGAGGKTMRGAVLIGRPKDATAGMESSTPGPQSYATAGHNAIGTQASRGVSLGKPLSKEERAKKEARELANMTPGPGHYDTLAANGARIGSTGGAALLIGRHSEREEARVLREATPGPQYDVATTNAIGTMRRGFSMSGRAKEAKVEERPGPANYSLTQHKGLGATVSRGPILLGKPKQLKKDDDMFPGPSDYAPSETKPSGKGAVLLGKPKEKKADVAPGPAEYSVSEFDGSIADGSSDPGSLNDALKRRRSLRQKGVTIGARVHKDAPAIGPGPARETIADDMSDHSSQHGTLPPRYDEPQQGKRSKGERRKNSLVKEARMTRTQRLQALKQASPTAGISAWKKKVDAPATAAASKPHKETTPAMVPSSTPGTDDRVELEPPVTPAAIVPLSQKALQEVGGNFVRGKRSSKANVMRWADTIPTNPEEMEAHVPLGKEGDREGTVHAGENSGKQKEEEEEEEKETNGEPLLRPSLPIVSASAKTGCHGPEDTTKYREGVTSSGDRGYGVGEGSNNAATGTMEEFGDGEDLSNHPSRLVRKLARPGASLLSTIEELTEPSSTLPRTSSATPLPTQSGNNTLPARTMTSIPELDEGERGHGDTNESLQRFLEMEKTAKLSQGMLGSNARGDDVMSPWADEEAVDASLLLNRTKRHPATASQTHPSHGSDGMGWNRGRNDPASMNPMGLTENHSSSNSSSLLHDSF